MEAIQKLPQLTYEQVKDLLHTLHLHICKDRFGDAEYYWYHPSDGANIIAEGYFGAGDGSVSFKQYSNSYRGDLAYDLRTCYSKVSVSHNDIQGE